MNLSAQRIRVPAYIGVAMLAFTAIAADGYDLTIFGASTPDLLAYSDWGLTPARLGLIASTAIMGMALGSIVSGMLADRFGARRIFLLCVTWFSIGMLLCAAAPTAELLGIARFATGLGLGGVVPTAIALTMSTAPPNRKNFLNGLMLSGLPLGGILASLSALIFIGNYGWRGVFALGGAVPLLIVVPIALAKLSTWAPTVNPASDAAKGTRLSLRSSLRTLVGNSGWQALTAFAAITFCCQLLSYGLLTWLPQIMKTSGYSLGSALVFLVIFSVGAMAGASGGAWAADRIGGRRATITGFTIGAFAILALSMHPPLWILYVFLFFAGAGTVGTQPVVYGFVATYFPADVRSTALGFVAGLGRVGGVCGPILGGLLAGRAAVVNFSVFAAIAAFAAVLAWAALARKARVQQHAAPAYNEFEPQAETTTKTPN